MSETTNLKLLKHDNAETNRNKFDIEKALNENWDKIDNYAKQVNNNISDINKELENFDRFTYKGIVNTYSDLTNKIATKGDIYKTKDNNKNYIYDGETWIEYELKINLDSIEENIETNKNNIKIITDCISNPVEISGETIHIEDSSENLCEIEIEGNSKQETREGYNVLLQDKQGYTQNSGVTVNFNKDGTINVQGTATEIIDIRLCNTYNSEVVQFKLKAGNYKFTANSDLVYLYLVNKTTSLHPGGNKEGIIQVTEDFDVTYAFIRIPAGTTINTTLKPLLYLYDGQEKPYEQYGASPSPNYPSEIETTGNNINLFDGEYYDGKGYNTNTGALETNANLYCNKNYINILCGQRKITLSKNGVGKNTRFFFYNINKQYISTATGEKNVEIPKNAIYLNFQIAKDTVNNDMSNIKIEQGSTSTPYSKYGQGNIDTKICNKNLAIIELGSIHTSNGQNANSDFFYRTGFINTFNNKSFSASYETNANTKQIVIFEYDKYKNFLRYTFSNALKFTTTIGDNTKYIRARYATDGSSYTINSVMLNAGIATPYEEHKEQTYTMPIQEEMLEDDTFDWNKEEEVHTWGKVVLSGTESYTVANNSEGWIQFRQNIVNSALENTELHSTHFKYLNANIIYSDKLEGITMDTSNRIRISFKNSTILTVEDFKQWLKTQYEAGTPVTIYYKLAQEKRIPFTQEQKEIANKISRAKTYKPVTNIWTDGIGQIKVKYKKDPETIIGSEI